MAAYNWIHFEATCPSCHQGARVRCQTHIASDYGGDETGRFFDREYQLGDKMAWWPEGHKHFRDWREEWSGDGRNLPPNQAIEACYADCERCTTNLCAVILFENLRPVQITHLTLAADWPEGYSA